jgi:hypothetical protein
MPSLVTKADFAKRAGVTKQAIGVAAGPGGPLAAAVLDGKIDTSHKAAKTYLNRRKSVAKAARSKTKPADTPSQPQNSGDLTDDGTPGFIVDVMQLRLGELSDKFGGRAELTEWLKAGKIAEDWRTARLKNDETDGTLIPRELVATHVFGAIDEQNKRLLTDAVKTIVRTVYSAASAEIPIEQTEATVRGILSKILDPVKRKASKVLREG